MRAIGMIIIGFFKLMGLLAGTYFVFLSGFLIGRGYFDEDFVILSGLVGVGAIMIAGLVPYDLRIDLLLRRRENGS